MTCSKSDFDPSCLEQYTKAPLFLHFQWEGKWNGDVVHRYALVDKIPVSRINSRTKVAIGEEGKTKEEILKGYLK